MRKFVIGLGTGRCGTRSLTKLLKENGYDAYHEHYALPWKADYEKAANSIKDLESRSDGKIASVAFYWLNYIEWVWFLRPETKCICLKRDKEKVIKSFLRSTDNLSEHFKMWNILDAKFRGINLKPSLRYDKSVLNEVNEGTREWLESYWDVDCYIDQVADSFPDYKVDNKRSYLERYWDEYNSKAERLSKDSRFLLIDVECLNSEAGRSKILNWL